MNRYEWKAAYSAARRASSLKRNDEGVLHVFGIRGYAFWQTDDGRTVLNAIIRDRPASQLIATELRWARLYRQKLAQAKRPGSLMSQATQRRAHLACIADCRKWRRLQSAFARIP